MNPSDLNLSFSSFRPSQLRMMDLIAQCKKRFLALDIPTGGGKSLGYVAAAIQSPGRSLILTQSRQLQDQLKKDFGEVILDVRGKQNYPCVEEFPDMYHSDIEAEMNGGNSTMYADEAPCNEGYECPLKDDGCLYYDAVRKARGARIVSTNYHFWLSQRVYAEGLGRFDMIVMDEAHNAGEVLCDFMRVEIERNQMEKWAVRAPKADEKLEVWKEWGQLAQGVLGRRLKKEPPQDKRGYRRLKEAIKSVGALGKVDQGWVRDVRRWEYKGGRYEKVGFAPVWPGEHLATLVGDTAKVVMTSATITRKTMELLGVKRGEFDFREFGSTFDKSRRPLYFLPAARVDSKGTREQQGENMEIVAEKAAAFIRARRLAKGIVHSVSYQRMREFADRIQGKVGDVEIITHDPGKVGEALKEFQRLEKGAILVTPAAGEGVDLPYDLCRYQVILKVPFPDSRDPVTAQRTKDDPEYPFYCVGQKMSQMYGRIMRAEDDWGETIILDSNWAWAREKCGEFVPGWVWEAERRVQGLPGVRNYD